jgi:hypothetical protein
MRYAVSDGHTMCFGYGATKGEALADYKQTLVDYLRFLDKYKLFLSPQPELEWMRQMITWRY